MPLFRSNYAFQRAFAYAARCCSVELGLGRSVHDTVALRFLNYDNCYALVVCLCVCYGACHTRPERRIADPFFLGHSSAAIIAAISAKLSDVASRVLHGRLGDIAEVRGTLEDFFRDRR